MRTARTAMGDVDYMAIGEPATFRQDPAFLDLCAASKGPNRYVKETRPMSFFGSVLQVRQGAAQYTVLYAEWECDRSGERGRIAARMRFGSPVTGISFTSDIPFPSLPLRIQNRLSRLARRAGIRDLQAALGPPPAIVYTTDLRVFTCDCGEWIVARSPEDAAAVWNEQCGGGFLIGADDKPVTWVECAPDATMQWSEDEGPPYTRKTFAELAKMNGRGHLASGNW